MHHPDRRSRARGSSAAVIVLALGISASSLLTQQRPCSVFTFDPPTAPRFSGTGGTGTVRCTKGPIVNNVYTGCTWTATSNVPWITITAGAVSGPTGVGTVTYVVAANGTSVPRTGSITFRSEITLGTYDTATYTVSQDAGTAGPSLAVTPASLTFTHTQSATVAPPAQTLVVRQLNLTTRIPVSFTVSTITSTGGRWLTAAPQSGQVAGGGSQDIQVSVNPSGLSPGTYTGTVSIREADLQSGLSVPVTLQVLARPQLAIPKVVSFAVTPGAGPVSKTVAINSRTLTSVPFSAKTSVATVGVSNWLSLDFTSGVTPANLNVSVNPAGLGVGRYVGLVTLQSEMPGCDGDSCLSTQTFAITADTTGSSGVSPLSAFRRNLEFRSGVLTNEVVRVSGQSLPFQMTVVSPTDDVACVTPENCWLAATPQPPDPPLQTPRSVNVEARPSLAVEGEHLGFVQIQDPTSGLGDIVTVQYLSASSGPVLRVGNDATGALDVVVAENSPPSSAAVAVNSTSGTLAYTATYVSDRRWLSGPTSGTTGSSLRLNIDPGGLTPGSYGGSVILRAPGSVNGEATLSITLQVLRSAAIPSQPTGYMAQFADSNNWKTTFILVNTDASASDFRLAFRSGTGSSVSLPIEGSGPQTEVRGTIPVNGTRTLETIGTASLLSQGSAQLTATQAVGGTAIFRQRVPGRPDSEAAAPLLYSPNRRQLLAFDNMGDYATSVALVNADTTLAAIVNATFRDETGAVFFTDSFTLDAGGQRPFSLPETYPALRNRRGVAEFSSSTNIAGLGLRFSPNQTFTSFNLLTPGAAAGGISQVGSQIADGQGWKTTIILVNTDSAPAPFTLRFWRGDGAPLLLPLGVAGTRSEYAGTIPQGGVIFLETDGMAAGLSQGWAEIVSTSSVGGTVVFRQRVAGRPDSEAAVAITGRSTTPGSLVIPFDNTRGFVTSMALVNADPAATAAVTVTLRDEEGRVLSTESLPVLNSRGQTAFESTRYTSARNTRGTAEFSARGIELFGLGLRFSPVPLATFTSLPALRK